MGLKIINWAAGTAVVGRTQWESTMRRRTIRKNNRRTGEAIRDMRERAADVLDLDYFTVPDAAAAAGTSVRTWEAFEAGEKPMPEAMIKLFWFTVGLTARGEYRLAKALNDLYERERPR